MLRRRTVIGEQLHAGQEELNVGRLKRLAAAVEAGEHLWLLISSTQDGQARNVAVEDVLHPRL